MEKKEIRAKLKLGTEKRKQKNRKVYKRTKRKKRKKKRKGNKQRKIIRSKTKKNKS